MRAPGSRGTPRPEAERDRNLTVGAGGFLHSSLSVIKTYSHSEFNQTHISYMTWWCVQLFVFTTLSPVYYNNVVGSDGFNRLVLSTVSYIHNATFIHVKGGTCAPGDGRETRRRAVQLYRTALMECERTTPLWSPLSMLAARCMQCTAACAPSMARHRLLKR